MDMTCYQRHMGWLFEALELPYEKDERRAVDTALRTVLKTPEGAHCPQVWRLSRRSRTKNVRGCRRRSRRFSARGEAVAAASAATA